jgi:hypothetical protein
MEIEEMVIVEKVLSGGAVLKGRTPHERIEVMWWPCSGSTIRRAATEKLSRKWVDECVKFANEEFARS